MAKLIKTLQFMFARLNNYISYLTNNLIKITEPFHGLLHFLAQVRQRLRQERATQTASSLTFTTVLALVPLVTVALAIFTVFPAFEKLRLALEDYFIESLMPVQVASVVTSYLMQFATKAKSLSTFGVAFLLFTALTMFITLEKSMNAIWQVPDRSVFAPQGHRWLIGRLMAYWSVLSIAPFAVGASFYAMAQVISSAKGYGMGLPQMGKLVMQTLPFVLAVSMWALIFKVMPNTQVRWRHAWIGAFVSGVLLEILKQAFVVYLAKYANFKELYGAFNVAPVLLIWLFLGWWATLLGAAIAAMLPSWGTRYIKDTNAFSVFIRQLRILHCLYLSQTNKGAGTLSIEAISKACYLPLDVAQTHVFELELLGVVAKIQSQSPHAGNTWVLLQPIQHVKVKLLLDATVWCSDPMLEATLWGKKWQDLADLTILDAMVLINGQVQDNV